MPKITLPLGYHLDERDPDVVVLLGPDGDEIASFSAMGATMVSIREAAEEDARRREQAQQARPEPRSGPGPAHLDRCGSKDEPDT